MPLLTNVASIDASVNDSEKLGFKKCNSGLTIHQLFAAKKVHHATPIQKKLQKIFFNR